MKKNLVEFVAGLDDECSFDQPCKYGHRVDGHAIYCHNEKWKDSPKKCRRSWYTGKYKPTDEESDYQCKGFELNPNYKK